MHSDDTLRDLILCFLSLPSIPRDRGDCDSGNIPLGSGRGRRHECVDVDVDVDLEE